MRSIPLPLTVTAAALAALALTACGAPKPADITTPAGTTMSATPTDDDAELAFLKLTNRIAQGCTPDAPSTATPSSGSEEDAPRPEDLPGGDAQSAVTGTPTPPPVEEPAPPTPDGTLPVEEVNEVPLSGLESCSGQEHIKRIAAAFKNAGTTTYAQMADKLTNLGYPTARIHQMPDHSGSPRARLDLRTMGSHLAVEVTATNTTAMAEAFGVPEAEGVDVTQVQRTPGLDSPTG